MNFFWRLLKRYRDRGNVRALRRDLAIARAENHKLYNDLMWLHERHLEGDSVLSLLDELLGTPGLPPITFDCARDERRNLPYKRATLDHRPDVHPWPGYRQFRVYEENAKWVDLLQMVKDDRDKCNNPSEEEPDGERDDQVV